jgi:hypothetical protein
MRQRIDGLAKSTYIAPISIAAPRNDQQEKGQSGYVRGEQDAFSLGILPG